MDKAVDYQALFYGLPGCHVVLTKDLIIITATKAYYVATHTLPEVILNKYIFDVFPETPQTVPKSTGKDLSYYLQKVLETKRTQTMPLQRYDLSRVTNGHNITEAHWWRMTNTPILDKNGSIVYIVNTVEDVTQVMGVLEAAEDTVEKLKES